MKSFLQIGFLKCLWLLLPCLGWSTAFRCDLYFLTDPNKPALSYEPIIPRIREYPLSIRVIPEASGGPDFPSQELKTKLGLSVAHHVSWAIPSFSQKIFISLLRESAVIQFEPHGKPEYPFGEWFDNYTTQEGPISKSVAINRQFIGMMEIFSYKHKKLKCALTISDPPYRLQMQDELPLEQWIVIDTPSQVAILYISLLSGA